MLFTYFQPSVWYCWMRYLSLGLRNIAHTCARIVINESTEHKKL